MNQETHKIIKSHKYWRIWEMIPGILSLCFLIFPIIFSIIQPVWVAVFITLYATMWLFKSLRLTTNLTMSYLRSQKFAKTDWMKLISYWDAPKKLEYDLRAIEKRGIEDKKYYRTLLDLREQIGIIKRAGQYKKSDEIINAVIYMTYKESYELIREAIKSYAEGVYPSEKIIIVFSGEERDKENALNIANKIKDEFGRRFMDFIITIHPYGLPNEIPGKSSNATWAAKILQKYLDEKNIKYENVIISNFDADTVTHKNYFAELTYTYLKTLNRERQTYQPRHFYHNNIWSVPILIRLIVLGFTFCEMAEANDLKTYKAFSSRSMGMQLAIDTDFWDPMVIPEDSRQHWTAYFLKDGKYHVVLIESPIYMDAVSTSKYFDTFKEQYIQLRRWAYGACDLPFVVFNMLANKKIPLFMKIYQIAYLMESHLMWATAPIILTFTGWLPGMLNASFRTTVMAYKMPGVVSYLLTFAGIGVVVYAIITFTIIPRPRKHITWKYISLLFQWLFVPLASIFLSSIPALEAQMRLLFNKKLEYKVSPKVRK